MTAGTKVVSIVVRRARPVDCVNIYRLIKPLLETQVVEPDEGKSLAYVLHLVENAYVVVADLSGRVVGAAVCSAYPPPFSREFLIDLEFLAAAPSFEQRGVKQALLRNVVNYARKNDAALRMALGPEDAASQGSKLLESGFSQVSQVFAIGKSKYAELQPAPAHAEDPAEDPEWEPSGED